MNTYRPDQVRRRRSQYVPRNPSAVYGATTCAFVTPVDVESRCCYAGMVPGGRGDEDNDPTEDANPVVHISTSMSQHEHVPVGVKRPRSESVVIVEDSKFVEYVVHFCRWGAAPGDRRHRLVGSFWLEAGTSCVALYQAVQTWSGIPSDRQRIALFSCHTNIDDEYIPVAESILAPGDMLPKCPGACVLLANEATHHLGLAASPVLFSDSTVDETTVTLRYFSVCTVVSTAASLQFASPSFVIAFPAGQHVEPRDIISVAAGVLSRGSRVLEQYLKRLHLIHIQVQGQNGNVCFTEAPPVFVSALTSSLYEKKQARRRGIDIAPVVPASLVGTAADYTSGIPSMGTARSCPSSQLDRVALVLSLRGSTICSLFTGKEPLASVTQGAHNTEASCFATTAATSLDGHHTFNSVWISDILPV